MRRLEAMGTYTDDEINHLARGGKQQGHIAGVGRVLPARATASPRIVDGERIPYEPSPATFPRRLVAGERYPQRQVAGESPRLSLGKAVNVVVTLDFGLHLYASATISLISYTDANWTGYPSTRSVEAEYRGVANVVAETAWLRNLLPEVLWTPQQDNDTLSEQRMLEAYPLLRPL
nr:NBS-containing resistance-like protein [Tanacetum cinerariifolium]